MPRVRLGLWRIPYFCRAVWMEGPRSGYDVSAAMMFGQLQMEHAARKLLSPLQGYDTGPESSVHLLTGAQHYYQTLFCAYSVVLNSPRRVRIVVHSDGTLGEETREHLRRVLPLVTFPDPAAEEAAVAAYLPRDRFPHLWRARTQLTLMRKLMDVHAAAPGRKVFLDSDMLFFTEPSQILDWLHNAQPPCCMEDVRNSYGYTDELLERCAGVPIPEFVNTGICGLCREDVDWDRLEFYAHRLMAAAGVNHYLEQALTAMLFAAKPFARLPRRHYIVCPLREQVIPDPDGIMHHYVSDSRKYLFRFGWRIVMAQADRRRNVAGPLDPTRAQCTGRAS